MPRSANIKASQIMGLIEAQGFKCALSGRDLTPETASIDHATPLSRGGQHVPENLVVLDSAVNKAKGTMTIGEFVALCCQVADRARQN